MFNKFLDTIKIFTVTPNGPSYINSLIKKGCNNARYISVIRLEFHQSPNGDDIQLA